MTGERKGGTRVVRETRENVGCNYVDVCRCDMYVVFRCHFSRIFTKKELFIQSYVINPSLYGWSFICPMKEKEV